MSTTGSELRNGASPRELPLPGPADVVLADGRLGVIRRMTPADGPALHQLHDEVSDDSLRMRFFNVSRPAAHSYVDHVLTHPETLALVAEVDGRLEGFATAEPILTETVDTVEIALLVSNAHHGQGLGTLLLEHLFALARDRGVRRVEAEVLVENHPMLEVLAHAGFGFTQHPDRGVVSLDLNTTSTPAVQSATDRREFQAQSRSLAPLLAPRSVAVTGVRSDGSGVGAAVLRSIVTHDYSGRVVVVHPRHEHVSGVRAFPSFRDVPDPVDLAVIAVPAEATASALEDAAAGGVRAAVVISSGFGELGHQGTSLQRELSVLARTHGIRLVGPNCLGVLANDPAIRLNATFNAQQTPPAGGLAIASQSGGVGIVLLDRARELSLGVRSFVSLGNTADVSSNDLLAAWFEDPGVSAAALYLESFGNARKFARFARRFSERKPLLAVVVGGRSTSGRRGGDSHTAAAASSDVAVQALFAQSGVIGCVDTDDLAEAALLLTEQPLPAGPRLAVLSNAGGMGILVADAAEARDLVVPEFTTALSDRLAGLVQGRSGTTNPVDAGAAVAPEQMAAALDAVLSSGEIDAVVNVVVATGVTDGVEVVRQLAEVCARYPEVPAVLVPLGGLKVRHPVSLTTYGSPVSAVRALGHAVGYARWRAVPAAPLPVPDQARALAARHWCRSQLQHAPTEGRWLAATEARHLLGPYGFRVLGRLAVGADGAVEAAATIGFPVAVKAAATGAAHKSETRLVRTGLTSASAVRLAVGAFEAELGETEPEVLVQPMESGVEVALGVVRDPSMGPLVMVAAGGVATDVWDDRAFLLPPVSLADAQRAVRGLRMWPLLQGSRGVRAADVADLEQLVVDLGRLAVDVPEIAELDLNPVMVGPDTCSIVDVRLRLARTDDPGPGAPRQLRRIE